MICGKEGTGKSTLGLACLDYLSGGKATEKNICFNSEEVLEKLDSLPTKSIIMLDEAGLVLMGKDAMTREQKKLIKILQLIRQKQFIMILISPSFHEMSKYISCSRSKFLLYTYSAKSMQRGRFCFFGETKLTKLYTLGKKYNSYKYPKATFIGSFVKYEPEYYPAYLKAKQKSLRDTFDIGKKQLSREDYKFFILECLERMKDKKIKVKVGVILSIFRMSESTYYKYLKEITKKMPFQREMSLTPHP